MRLHPDGSSSGRSSPPPRVPLPAGDGGDPARPHRPRLSLAAQDGLSLRHFESLLAWDKGWLPSIVTSLVVATISSAIAVAFAAAFAIGAWGLGGWWPSLVRLVLLAPLIVPPIVYAVGIFRMWAKLDLLDSYTGVIIVHVVLAMPFAVLAIGASLANLDPRILQAARSLGAGRQRSSAGWCCPTCCPPRGRRPVRVHHLLGRDHGDPLHHQPGGGDAATADLDRHRGQHRPHSCRHRLGHARRHRHRAGPEHADPRRPPKDATAP